MPGSSLFEAANYFRTFFGEIDEPLGWCWSCALIRHDATHGSMHNPTAGNLSNNGCRFKFCSPSLHRFYLNLINVHTLHVNCQCRDQQYDEYIHNIWLGYLVLSVLSTSNCVIFILAAEFPMEINFNTAILSQVNVITTLWPDMSGFCNYMQTVFLIWMQVTLGSESTVCSDNSNSENS
jgi:hypothetical protein